MALTAQQIVNLATQDAKVPGMLSQAGQCLNQALAELCVNEDIAVARGFFTFNFVQGLISSIPSFPNVVAGGGPYALPADYLRANYGDVIFTDNSPAGSNTPYRMDNIEIAGFDLLIQQAGIQSYPNYYATDLSLQYAATPLMVVWPPPNGNYPVSIRYFRQMPDITTPETSSVVPWFPSSMYLRKKTAALLMDISDDTRAPAFNEASDEILRRYMRLQNDKSNRAQVVRLDPLRFGADRSTLPNTKSIWI